MQYEDGDEDPRIKFLTYELVLDEESGTMLVRVTRSTALNSKEGTPEVPELSVAALPKLGHEWHARDVCSRRGGLCRDRTGRQA